MSNFISTDISESIHFTLVDSSAEDAAFAMESQPAPTAFQTIPECISLLFAHPDKRAIVVTDSEDLVNMVNAANSCIPRKAFVMLRGRLVGADEVREQINDERTRLTDALGNEYRLTAPPSGVGMFALESGGTVISDVYLALDDDLKHLHTIDGKGYYLLPSDRFYRGIMANLLSEGTERERIDLAWELANYADSAAANGIIPDYASAVVFESEDGDLTLLIREDTAEDNLYRLAKLMFFAVTGLSLDQTEDDRIPAAVLKGIVDAPVIYPSYFLDDVEAALIKHEALSPERWVNTMERLLLCGGENGFFEEKRLPQTPILYTPDYITSVED